MEGIKESHLWIQRQKNNTFILYHEMMIAEVTDTLFELYSENKSKEESRPGGMGYFFRRVNAKGIISSLKSNPKTAELMKKAFKGI